MKLLLEVLGYEAETARDGAAALALQHAHGFGVLITDIFMPGIEGMETIARFKAAWPGMRVIAMSGGGERTKRRLPLGGVADRRRCDDAEALLGRDTDQRARSRVIAFRR